MKNVLILGAAGRDFHNFNVVFRNNPEFNVVAFTATQIPDIAGRRYPAELAGHRYPQGILITDEKNMEAVIRDRGVDIVVFSYSDVSYPTLMHLASRTAAAGPDFWLLGAERTQIKSVLPVISICAVRTGCGKSPVSRLVAEELRAQGWKPVVIRHPMPYGDLAAQSVQRFGCLADLDRNQCTIEEREEYEPHIQNGTVVYAGVDYERILRSAEQEADIILWDGGNNDTPFYAADLEIVIADPHRPGHELAYYPGEVNMRRAQVVVINKVDTAKPADIETVRRTFIRTILPRRSSRWHAVFGPFAGTHPRETCSGHRRWSHTNSRRNAVRRWSRSSPSSVAQLNSSILALSLSDRFALLSSAIATSTTSPRNEMRLSVKNSRTPSMPHHV